MSGVAKYDAASVDLRWTIFFGQLKGLNKRLKMALHALIADVEMRISKANSNSTTHEYDDHATMTR